MPPKEYVKNYEDAKIYRLIAVDTDGGFVTSPGGMITRVWKGTEDVYIGSTCSSLKTRLHAHNFAAANPDSQTQSAACKLYEGGKKVVIELVENYPCKTKEELNARERYWIENTLTCINKNIPGQTWKERAIKRDTEIKEYMMIYRATKHECDCGVVVGYADKARHMRSKKHIEKMKQVQ